MKLMMSTLAIAMMAVTGSAQAVLTSANTLTIQNDTVSTFGINPNDATTTAVWYVVSDGPMLDSFFTMGGSKLKNEAWYGYQYTYLDGASLTLNGSTQANIATGETYQTWLYPDEIGVFKTAGTGISILSASGDTATVDMSGWKWDWSGVQNIDLGSGAWSSGFSNGVGVITCTAGSGCAAGSAYTLEYTATFAPDGNSGFEGVKYYLELHGTVGAVPEASTYGMMLVGLVLVVAAAGRGLGSALSAS